jgi:hypothetical protein
VRQDGESKVARIRMTKNSGVSYFTQNPFFFPLFNKGERATREGISYY